MLRFTFFRHQKFGNSNSVAKIVVATSDIMPSNTRIPLVVCCTIAILLSIIFSLVKNTPTPSLAALYILSPISLLTFLGWIFVSIGVPVFEDEADQYEVGADAWGVTLVIPLGFSSLWVAALVFLLVVRGVMGEEVLVGVVKQVAVFAVASVGGCLIVCFVPMVKKRLRSLSWK